MKSKTATLAAALRILANDIQSPDDIPATCLREAADRLECLARERDTEQKRADGHYDNYCQVLKQIDQIANQRDKAWDEIKRLKTELHKTIQLDKLSNLEPKTTRPEPSRLEIAAMIMAANVMADAGENCALNAEWSLQSADALIAAAKEVK
jgi:hypothetical protein